MLVDTHLHLAEETDEEIRDIINRAEKNDVTKFIISGTNEEDNERNIEIANNFENIFVTIGYHPSEVEAITDFSLDKMKKQLQFEKAVAIGEIGLDYYYGKDTKEKQISLFESQLKLAETLNLPVVVHSRDATLDTMNILKKYDVKGVIHCFSGSLETALEYIKMGFYLGIGGVLTFKNSNLKDVVEKIDLKYLLLETDSPFLSPVRGNKNDSSNIKIIANALALIKDLSVDEVAKITTENACTLFDLNR